MHNNAIAQKHHCTMMKPRPVGNADLSAAPEVSDDWRPPCIKMQICKRPLRRDAPAGYGGRPCTRPSGPICNCIFPSGTTGAEASLIAPHDRQWDAYLHKRRAVPRTVRPAVDWSGIGRGSARRDRRNPCLCWPAPSLPGGTSHGMRVGPLVAGLHNCITHRAAADNGARLSPASTGLRNCIFAQAPPAAATSCANSLPAHVFAHLHKRARAKAPAPGRHRRPGSPHMQLHH
jgi:hypothetical protein